VQKLQAALDEKVKNKLIPDTETTVKIEPGRPPFVASDPRPRASAKEGQAIYAEIERQLDIAEMTGGATDAGLRGPQRQGDRGREFLAWPAGATTPATSTSTPARSCRGFI